MPGGRPTKYRKEYAKQAKKLCELGATDLDLAEFFCVADSTLRLWTVTHKEFSASLRVDKDGYDDRVERSLAMRAMGSSHPETKVNIFEGEVILTTVMKHYPPETKAASIWLANRRSKKWRLAQHVNHDDETTAEPKKVVIEVVDSRKK